MLALSTFRARIEGRVLFATPLNLIGPEVVHDMVDLVQYVQNRENDVAVWSSTAPAPSSSVPTWT
jgi:hypothetical protein